MEGATNTPDAHDLAIGVDGLEVPAEVLATCRPLAWHRP